jgi:hypothetical protein
MQPQALAVVAEAAAVGRERLSPEEHWVAA